MLYWASQILVKSILSSPFDQSGRFSFGCVSQHFSGTPISQLESFSFHFYYFPTLLPLFTTFQQVKGTKVNRSRIMSRTPLPIIIDLTSLFQIIIAIALFATVLNNISFRCGLFYFTLLYFRHFYRIYFLTLLFWFFQFISNKIIFAFYLV